MERLFLFIRVSFALWIGLFLLVIPWLDGGRIFAGNRLVQDYPALRAFLAHGFVRGAVSGVGLLDIWLGIWEAVHYKGSIRA